LTAINSDAAFPTGHRAVAFADLAGYTALTEAHGDDEAANIAIRFFDLTEARLRADARIVKTIGDAVMVVTSDAYHALEMGLAVLRAIRQEPQFPGVRIGVHYGPVVERSGDVFGATVNIAARLTAHAHVGQLIASGAIACLVEAHPKMTTTALGATWLNNVSEPVEIYSIAEHGASATSQVLDPVCRMFVDADAAPAHLPWDGHAWHFCSFECAKTFTQDPGRYVDRQGSGGA
jgi:class 3 adenylate cyclase/YHS domain-containing protein